MVMSSGGCQPKEVPGRYYDGRAQAPQQTTQAHIASNENFHDGMQRCTDSCFWRKMAKEVEQSVPSEPNDLKMPLARVKRMIKSDDEVKVRDVQPAGGGRSLSYHLANSIILAVAACPEYQRKWYVRYYVSASPLLMQNCGIFSPIPLGAAFLLIDAQCRSTDYNV